MHRLYLLMSALCLATVGCSPEHPLPTPPPSTTAAEPSALSDSDVLIARGRAISSQTFALLSSNLLAAVRQSGVSNALPFCSALAMPLTSVVANTNDVALRRVSHRPRNPANRGNPRELALIESYRSTLADGGTPQPVLVTNDTLTFYAPIVITNQLCLQCHGKPGEDILPENLKIIQNLYPADEATGFGLGDVRGLWRIDFKPVVPTTNEPATRPVLQPTPPRARLGAAWLLPLVAALGSSTSVAVDAAPAPIDQAWFEAHYTKHEHYIPMRDGARLFTAIYTPKDESSAYPIWLMRTPYGLRPYGVDAYPNPNRAPIQHFARDLFIFVIQDVRGCNLSEGEFEHMRPIGTDASGPNRTDESTDAWDTIEWLVQNVPNNTGHVGLSGVSYPGFYAAAGAIDSHPALKAVSPQAPIADQFMGDDFHHQGAFFLPHAFHYFPLFQPKREKPSMERQQAYQDYGTRDGYAFYLAWESLAETGDQLYEGRIPFWNQVMEHGTYDAFWQTRNLRPHLRNIRAAMLTVGGWFDAENLFGALEVYRHTEQQNPGITNLLVMGPWSHGQWRSGEGESLGPIDFRSATADFFRSSIELPFFRHFLKNDPAWDLPEAFVFETGTCQWRRHDRWPPAAAIPTNLYFQPQGGLSFHHPDGGDMAFDEYVSDPWKPVPYISDISISMTRDYMVADQRFAARRPDVLVYQTEVLEEDLTLAGPIIASLHVSTSGTDSDWIVKVIDVYPDDHPDPESNPTGVVLGGYQQLVRGEVMRGKFRNSHEHPEPFVPGKTARVEWTMPDVCHAFRRGHRLMVQVQSTWFPLVDRNPQVFCDIYRARPDDFQVATQRVHRAVNAPSAIRLSVLP